MRTNSARAHKSEEGNVMILALILLVVGTLLITPLLGFMSTGLTAGQVYENKTSELYAADAGVMDAIWKIQSGSITAPRCGDDQTHWPYNITDRINGKNVSVEVAYVDHDTFRITSNATDENGSGTTIESYVFYGSEWGRLLDFGVIAHDGDIDIESNTVLDSYPQPNNSHIYANGHIRIGDNAQVRGLATATGEITGKENISPGPAIDDLDPPLEFVLPGTTKYLDEANAAGVIHEGDLTINESMTLQPMRITGTLSIGGDAVVTLGGTVWVEEEVKMAGGALIAGRGPLVAVRNMDVRGTNRPAPEELPVLISSEGDIAAGGTGTVYAVLYAPNGIVSITGTASANGAIIGKSVFIKTAGKTEVRYDLTVVDRVRVPGLEIHTWEIK